jgi:hypothetical protein
MKDVNGNRRRRSSCRVRRSAPANLDWPRGLPEVEIERLAAPFGGAQSAAIRECRDGQSWIPIMVGKIELPITESWNLT